MKLASFEARWASAVFDAAFPRAGAAHDAEERASDRFASRFAESYAALPFEPAVGIRLALWLVALAPIFAIGRLATIGSLDRGERERVLRAIGESSNYAVRQLFVALRAIGALVCAPELRAVALRRNLISPASLTARHEAVPPPIDSGVRVIDGVLESARGAKEEPARGDDVKRGIDGKRSAA